VIEKGVAPRASPAYMSSVGGDSSLQGSESNRR